MRDPGCAPLSPTDSYSGLVIYSSFSRMDDQSQGVADPNPARLGSAFARAAPLHRQLAAVSGAVAEVEIDEALVGQLGLDREPLEVLNGLVVEPDRDRALELPRVGVALCLGKVVVGFHRELTSLYCVRSPLVARRAEMMRTVSSSSWYARTTTRIRTDELRPSRTNRSSSCECSGSAMHSANSSANAVLASSKVTPCLTSLAAALRAAESNRRSGTRTL